MTRNTSQLLAVTTTLALILMTASDVSAGIRHEYNFDIDGTDSVGTADLSLGGAATWGGGSLVIPGGAPRTNNAFAQGPALAELAGTINGTDTLSVVVRYNTSVAQTWSKVFMTGEPGGEPGLSYLDITPQRGNGQDHGMTFNDSLNNEVGVTGLPIITPGTNGIAVAVWDELADMMTLHVAEDGNLASLQTDTASMAGGDLAAVSITEFYLGSAVNFGDADFNGSISQVQIYDHSLSLSEVQDLVVPSSDDVLTLEVNTTTGAVNLKNTSAMDPRTFNYYQIDSPGGALSVSGWNSLSDQNLDPVNGGDDPGETWDESPGSGPNLLSELFLQGSSTIDPSESLSLGNAFNPLVFGNNQDGDLTFSYANSGQSLVTGLVEYVTGGLTCDVNGDSACNLMDIDLLYDEINAGTNGAIFDFNGDGSVNNDDIADWLALAGAANGKTYLNGDTNLDGSVNGPDFTALAVNFGNTGLGTDPAYWGNGNFDGNNGGSFQVGGSDFTALAFNFGFTSAAAVPEPSASVVALFCSCLVFLLRKRS